MKHSLWLLLALFLPIQTTSAIGEQYGRITGIVYNPEGAELAGVKLTLTSPVLITGPRNLVSAEDGSFTFNSLPPAKYDLTVENPGLRTITKTGISVSVGKTASLYIAMELATDENGTLKSPSTQAAKPVKIRGMTQGVSFIEEINSDIPTGRSYRDVHDFLPGNPSYPPGRYIVTCCFADWCPPSGEIELICDENGCYQEGTEEADEPWVDTSPVIWPFPANTGKEFLQKLPKEGQSLQSFVLELPRTEVKNSILRINGRPAYILIDGQLPPPQMTKR